MEYSLSRVPAVRSRHHWLPHLLESELALGSKEGWAQLLILENLLKGQEGMKEQEATAGTGSGSAVAGDVLCGWIRKEDPLAFEVYCVPSLGPFSLQVLQLMPWLMQGKSQFWAGVFEEGKVGYGLCEGLSLPRGVSWGWCFAGEATPGGVGPFIFQDQAIKRSLIFLKDECVQPFSQEVHLHHCTKLPGTSSFFPPFCSYIRVTCRNCHLNSLPLSVLTPSIFWGLNLLLLVKKPCCAKRCLFLLLQMMQHQAQLTRSLSWRVGCMTRSAPDCGFGVRLSACRWRFGGEEVASNWSMSWVNPSLWDGTAAVQCCCTPDLFFCLGIFSYILVCYFKDAFSFGLRSPLFPPSVMIITSAWQQQQVFLKEKRC